MTGGHGLGRRHVGRAGAVHDGSSERGVSSSERGASMGLMSPVSSESSGVGSKHSSMDNICLLGDGMIEL